MGPIAEVRRGRKRVGKWQGAGVPRKSDPRIRVHAPDTPNMPGPLPEGLRMGVHAAYDKSRYGRFMVCIDRVQGGTMSVEDAYAEVFDILQYDGGASHNGKHNRDHTSKPPRPDLYQMFVEWSTAGPPALRADPNAPGPLPEALRMGMYEAYGHCRDYSEFMRRVVALQEGTMPLEVADNAVFDILGYDQGPNYATPRSGATQSHRPDLYRMFVAWSTAAPPAPGVDTNAPGPGPEAMRAELVLHELAFHQKVLEQLADKVHRMETRFSSAGVVEDVRNHLHVRIDTKMPPIPDRAPPRVVGQKSVPLSSDMPGVPGPLPEGLRKGVCEAYDQPTYTRFMRGTVALQEATMSFDEVDADVFSVLGFEGESHRPDLYQMFVEWSAAKPSVVKRERTGDPFKFAAIGLPAAPPMHSGAGGSTSVGVGASGPPAAPPMRSTAGFNAGVGVGASGPPAAPPMRSGPGGITSVGAGASGPPAAPPMHSGPGGSTSVGAGASGPPAAPLNHFGPGGTTSSAGNWVWARPTAPPTNFGGGGGHFIER